MMTGPPLPNSSRPARELRQFAHELARAVGNNQLTAAGWVVLRDVDRALQDDRHAEARLADLGQRLAFGKGADLAEPAHALDLRRRQRRKHLMAARVYDR